jgi:predicted DNA repair protein MutK
VLHWETRVHLAVSGVGALLGWLLNTVVSAVIGAVVGAVAVGAMHLVPRRGPQTAH